jgi:hypothetical protein
MTDVSQGGLDSQLNDTTIVSLTVAPRAKRGGLEGRWIKTSRQQLNSFRSPLSTQNSN